VLVGWVELGRVCILVGHVGLSEEKVKVTVSICESSLPKCKCLVSYLSAESDL